MGETENLTPEAVKAAVDLLGGRIGDDEARHIEEDDLHQTVLRAIAEGRCTDPAECARLALTTLDLDFERVVRLMQWIPVTERLPSKDGDYLTTCQPTGYPRSVWCAEWRLNNWYKPDGSMARGIVAWMPLPAPYAP